MAHTTSSGGLSSLSLDAPVEGTELGSGVTALGTGLLLLVVGTGTAAFAKGVGLGMAFTKTGGSLGLFKGMKWRMNVWSEVKWKKSKTSNNTQKWIIQELKGLVKWSFKIKGNQMDGLRRIGWEWVPFCRTSVRWGYPRSINYILTINCRKIFFIINNSNISHVANRKKIQVI